MVIAESTTMKFDDRPFIAIWETTQACDLVCKHCRACAQPKRDPRELTTAEGKVLLGQLAEGRVPLVVLTGGDPAKRPDLVELVRYGADLGLQMGLTPSATSLVTQELLEELARARLSRLAISIDGPDPKTHDAFRGVSGSFDDAWRILNTARSLGLKTQVNTSVHAGSIDRLPEIANLVGELGCVLWSVFYLVPTGRAEAHMLPTAEEVERTLLQLADIAAGVTFAVKSTAAQHYRRVLSQRKVAAGSAPSHGVHGKGADRINDGRGFLFISHKGEIFPSGFLPRHCGNVRDVDPVTVYRHHPIFRMLRDTNALDGKCGVCEYRQICSGSRARAYAMTGNLMASDPLCAYVPSSAPRPPVDEAMR